MIIISNRSNGVKGFTALHNFESRAAKQALNRGRDFPQGYTALHCADGRDAPAWLCSQRERARRLPSSLKSGITYSSGAHAIIHGR
jgi:hypothetical protein